MLIAQEVLVFFAFTYFGDVNLGIPAAYLAFHRLTLCGFGVPKRLGDVGFPVTL
jgi:hypothetical protein